MWYEQKKWHIECKYVTELCSFHILNFLWCITEQTHSNMELPYIVKEQNNVNGDVICASVL